jgi:hypothetical protein
MSIDYRVWGQHAVAEARYDKNQTGLQIRMPVAEVMRARDKFTYEDLETCDPHLDLQNQLYQFHLLHAGKGDGYVNNIPFNTIIPLLWFFHNQPDLRQKFLSLDLNVEFEDFLRSNSLDEESKLVHLDIGYEKYGMFDFTTVGDIFNIKQLHRLVLYGAFLGALGYHDIDQTEALPASLNGASPTKKVVEELMMSGHEVSEYASLTLIIEEGNEGIYPHEFKVCRNHPGSDVYWTEHKGRVSYKIINPGDPDALKLMKALAGTPEEKCPKCEKSVLQD